MTTDKEHNSNVMSINSIYKANCVFSNKTEIKYILLLKFGPYTTKNGNLMMSIYNMYNKTNI